MLGLIAAACAGATIKKIWPYGVLFLVAISASAVALDVFILMPDRRAMHHALGEATAPDLTFWQVILKFFVGLFLYSIPFFVSWLVARFVRNRGS